MARVRSSFAAGLMAGMAMLLPLGAFAQTPKTLVVGLDTEPPTLNAHANSDNKVLQMGHLHSCFLTSLNDVNGGPIQPAVAKSWEYTSPTEVVFTLRDDVKFHNGRALTPEDIVFTFNWMLNKDNGSIRLNNFGQVDRVEKSGDNAVTIHLKTAYPPLIEMLAYLPIVAEDTIGTLDTAPVGCGPFKFNRWDKDQQIVFDTNTEYYGGKIAYDQLVVRVFQDYNAEMTAFLAGEVDIFQWLSSVDIPTIAGRADKFHVQSIDDYAYYLSANTQVPELANPKVREAIKYAVDKNALVMLIASGFGKPISQVVAPSNPYYDTALDWERDVERAKKALVDGGFPNGVDIKLNATDGAVARNLATMLKEQLEEVGIRIQLDIMDSGSFFAPFNAGEFSLVTTGFGLFADPAFRSIFLLGSNPNWKRYGYQNAEYDALYLEGLVAPDVEARKAIYQKMWAKAIDEAGFLMLFTVSGNAAVKNSVKGLVYRSSGNSDYTRITLE